MSFVGAALTTALPVQSAVAEVVPGRPDNVLVSRAPNGAPANDASDRPQISGDGRHITFDSFATNLVPGITSTDRTRRVYVKDMVTGTITPVSVNNAGAIANVWSSFSYPSDDGSLVAFVSNATALALPAKATLKSVYVRDLVANRTELISVNNAGQASNGPASRPMLTGDGRFVAFNSTGSNLASQGGNGQEQVYVRDRLLKTTTLVSVATDGGLGNALSYRGMVSADGRYVTWASKATNLVSGPSSTGTVEAIYTRDMVTGVTTRVTNTSTGAAANGSRPYMTPDGQYISFNSFAPFTPGDNTTSSDTFVWSRATGAIAKIGGSDAQDEVDPDADSLRIFLSDDARYAVWNSFGNKLTPNDRNPAGDVFFLDRQTGTTTLLSLSWYGGAANGLSFRPVFSNDGNRVAYLSKARNLIQGDQSTGFQVYAMTTTSVTNFGLDTTPPSFSDSWPSAGSVVIGSGALTFSGTLADDRAVDRAFIQIRNTGTGLWLRADGTWGSTATRLPVTLKQRYAQTSAWSFTTALQPGKYAYQLVGYDVSNNVITTSPITPFTYSASQPDTVAPSLTIGAPATNTTTGSPVTFSGSASDDRGIERGFVSIRDNSTGLWLQTGGGWGSAAARLPTTLSNPGATTSDWSYTTALPDGVYGWTTAVYDAAGNISNKPFSKLTVSSLGPDTTPATASISAPAPDAVVSSPVTLAGTASDDRGVSKVFVQLRNTGTGLWLRTDGTWGSTAVRLPATLSNPNGLDTEWTFTPALDPGTYAFDVTALDAANNAPVKPTSRFTVS